MEQNCPGCDKHCPVDQPNCPTGEAYFRGETAVHSPQTEKMIVLLRKCGHFLHHHVDRTADTAALTAALDPEERAILEALLEKCLARWNADPAGLPAADSQNRENNDQPE